MIAGADPVTCRTVIADDHAIVRDATRPLLEAIPGVKIVGEADDGVAAIALAKRLRPDLLVLDIAMPQASGVIVLEEVRRFSPASRVAVFTAVTGAGVIAAIEASGVAGILLKSCSADELRRGFSAIIAGETYYCAEVRSILQTAEALRNLTARERQVLCLAARGRTNAEIAELLSISAKTADNHRSSVMRKLNVHTTPELVLFAVKEGLLDVAQA